MAQQTAVEWLFSQIPLEFSSSRSAYEKLEKALQMEKEQIINAWRNGDNDSIYNFKELDELAEQYYNETYNK